MTLMPRSEVAALAAAWSNVVEGHARAPQLTVSFTPAGLLVFMDRCFMASVEAILVPAAPVLDSRAVSGVDAAGVAMFHVEPEDAPPSPGDVVGATR